MYLLLTIFALAGLAAEALAEPYQPGEKCLGAPGRPEIAWRNPPCTPGYACTGEASDWGKICAVVTGDGDGCGDEEEDDGENGGGGGTGGGGGGSGNEDQFPLVRLPFSNRCQSNGECPKGSTCEEITDQTFSFAIGSGTKACSDFTRNVGETCHNPSSSDGESLFPSPGCLQDQDLFCSFLPGKEDQTPVCRKMIKEGGDCGDGKGVPICLNFGRRTRELACVDGKCVTFWDVQQCDNGSCPSGQVCATDPISGPGAQPYCVYKQKEGELCTWQSPLSVPARLYQCEETADDGSALRCIVDPLPRQFQFQGTCKAGLSQAEAQSQINANLPIG